ncbi:MAG: hypothetical protein A2X12_03825 [Bacteroidetes bacterium GWE2_29_8]|nr:MAG: hypothetical protein A2X12_03825 [Bacteroidetes bacterium GWE2_29_8]
MKKITNKVLVVVIIFQLLISSNFIQAGNKDRVGQAGAAQLLINPWARSSGWWNANSASVRGLEAMYSNIAGTAFTKRTEVLFSRTIWLEGSDVNINSFGLTQRVGESGVMGMSIMSMGFGEIDIRTVDKPEGGLGTFSPTFTNIGISYAKEFSNSIYGGINVKIISEGTSNIRGQGVAFDAGIQYVTGENDEIKLGISLKNVGTKMKYSGDGITFRGEVPGAPNAMTLSQRSADFELPSLINIGVSYDFTFTESHKLTAAANFTSNSFSNDQYMAGLEYRYLGMFMLRAGYMGEKNIFDKEATESVFKGPSTGLTVEMPFKKDSESSISIDYSYIATRHFGGCHSFGCRINL